MALGLGEANMWECSKKDPLGKTMDCLEQLRQNLQLNFDILKWLCIHTQSILLSGPSTYKVTVAKKKAAFILISKLSSRFYNGSQLHFFVQ